MTILDLSDGAHVVHVGAGTGYYSAILAEIAGRAGRVTAIEIDPVLAARASENLAAWPQATVVASDGFTFRPDRVADAIIVNAGVTHLTSVWLDALAREGGRLLVPLTNAEWWGLLRDDHSARQQPGLLPREVRWPGWGDPVYRRTRPGRRRKD